jgi:energy-coupling factor transporter transmembrane protein EcfT
MAATADARPRLDPRVAIGVFLSCALWIGSCRTIAGAAIWTLIIMIGVAVLRRLARGVPLLGIAALRWAMPAAVIVAMMYALLQPGDGRLLVRLGPIQIGLDGLATGVRLGLRLVAFAGLAVAVGTLANPSGLAAGVTRLLLPLRVLGFPVASMYYLMFFMLRMYPLLMEELQTIRLGQRSRGARFDGPWHTRIRMAAVLIIPAFAAALRRADRLSDALASRGFDVRRIPDDVYLMRFARRDWLTALLISAGWIMWLAARVARVDLLLF